MSRDVEGNTDDEGAVAVPPARPSHAVSSQVGSAASYHVRMSAEEVKVALASAGGVIAHAQGALPDIAPPVRSSEFVVEFEERGFRVHRSASERGESGTGFLTTIYLRARLRPTAEGTVIRLHFARGRPTWAIQRAGGLILVLLAGGLWAAQGGPAMVTRLVMLGLFALFVSPLVVNDLRAHLRSRADRAHLLGLAERVFGPRAIAGGAQPYRD